ncbi:MAG: LCP family protein [Caldilineales bacterium]|nr:LCP family protein [Caldilineales bacterium]MDW8318924.1 LCP family protein [Anaerolineae bacterium]
MPRSPIICVLLLGILSLALTGCASAAFGPEVLATRQPLDPANAAPLPNSPALAVASSTPEAVLALRREGEESMPGDASPIAPNEPVEPGSQPTATPTAAGEEGHPLQHTYNILLIGTDQADIDYIGRTDTIIIVAIDKANGRAAMISLPRDLYLPIPTIGYSRINTAYFFAEQRRKGSGVPVLVSTIERNFGIPIHNYVRIDFSGFKKVVDAVGGVDITVECPIYDDLFWRFFGQGTLEPGTYHMTGEQALYYARSRKTTSDFDRARRQQQVLLALRKRALDAELLPRLPALWRALRSSVDTDLDLPTLLELAPLGATIDTGRLHGLVLRPPLVVGHTTAQGAMVQVPDIPAINEALDHIWERKPITETLTEEKLCTQGE